MSSYGLEILLGYSGWLLGCCYAVAKVPWVVAKVLLWLGYPGGWYGTWGGC